MKDFCTFEFFHFFYNFTVTDFSVLRKIPADIINLKHVEQNHAFHSAFKSPFSVAKASKAKVPVIKAPTTRRVEINLKPGRNAPPSLPVSQIPVDHMMVGYLAAGGREITQVYNAKAPPPHSSQQAMESINSGKLL